LNASDLAPFVSNNIPEARNWDDLSFWLEWYIEDFRLIIALGSQDELLGLCAWRCVSLDNFKEEYLHDPADPIVLVDLLIANQSEVLKALWLKLKVTTGKQMFGFRTGTQLEQLHLIDVLSLDRLIFSEEVKNMDELRNSITILD
jgi:hypothetical protein